MTTPIEVVINGRDNTGSAFASAGGGIAKIGQIAMGILTSQVFVKLAQGVADFATSIVEEARESELVLAGLDQTLQTMGGVSGMTRDALIELADSIALNSTYTDEAILSASGLMLTFDKIGKETFPRAQQMAVDMAAKFDMDLSSATISLSKALQGTTGSLSALSKQGITFTDEQKNVIQTLFDTGHAAEAQAMIMDAIAPQVDGFAATQITAWQKVQKQFDNIKETLGTALLPAIDKLGGVMNEALANPEVQAAIDKLVTLLAENAPKAIDALIDGFEGLKKFSEGAGKSIAEFTRPFMPALRSIMDTFERMRPSIEKTAGVLGGKLVAAGKELYQKVFPFIVATADNFAIWLAKNRPLIEAFAAKLAERFAAFADGVVAFWAVVQPILEGLFTLIGGLATLIMQVATGDWAGAWETIKTTAASVLASIGEALFAFFDWIAGLMGGSLEQIKTTWSANWNQLKTILASVWIIIKSTISSTLISIVNFFRSAWNDIISSVSSFASNLIGSLTSAVSGALDAVYGMIGEFWNIGSEIINNIIGGLEANISILLDYLSGLITNLIGSLLGGGSGGGSGGGGGGMLSPVSAGQITAVTGSSAFSAAGTPGVLASVARGVINNYYNPQIVVYTGVNDPQKTMRGLI